MGIVGAGAGHGIGSCSVILGAFEDIMAAGLVRAHAASDDVLHRWPASVESHVSPEGSGSSLSASLRAYASSYHPLDCMPAYMHALLSFTLALHSVAGKEPHHIMPGCRQSSSVLANDPEVSRQEHQEFHRAHHEDAARLPGLWQRHQLTISTRLGCGSASDNTNPAPPPSMQAGQGAC